MTRPQHRYIAPGLSLGLSEISGTLSVPIAIGDFVTGSLDFHGDVDEFLLPVSAGDVIILVSTRPSSGIDIELTVLWPNGTFESSEGHLIRIHCSSSVPCSKFATFPPSAATTDCDLCQIGTVIRGR